MRGDRVAFVGPNGVGKTTLIEILTGQQKPDQGTITLGTNLEMAVFDQRRAVFDPDASLWDSLIGDKEMRVSGRADQVMVRGNPRHVVGLPERLSVLRSTSARSNTVPLGRRTRTPPPGQTHGETI